MAQFDVHAVDGAFLLDCQSGLLFGLNTRLVVPLILFEKAPKPADRLNPVLDIDGQAWVMMTQYMATVSVGLLGKPIGSGAAHHIAIIGAIDFLKTGY